MNKWLKRLSNWFFQIENEVMIPFVLGILVIGDFSVISIIMAIRCRKQ